MITAKYNNDREENFDAHKRNNIEKSRLQIIRNLEAQKKKQVQDCLDFFYNNKTKQ